MRNIKKKASALVLTTVFATMQISTFAAIDTGLGVGNGGAVINNATSGLVGVDTSAKSATLKFDSNTHVNWNTLNVNSGEALNFNAVNGANGLTVLNTVNQGMSNIYGQINANSGISNLVISNPNGVLFDGAKFSTAGDTMITAQGAALNAATGAVTYDPSATRAFTPYGNDYVIQVKNSDFSVGGDLNFVAPTMNVVKSAFKAGDAVKFTTTNGQDYFVTTKNSSGQTIAVNYNDPNYDAVVSINGNCAECTSEPKETQSMRLEAIQVDGDVYITSNKGIVKMVNGGEIKGDLNIQSDGSVAMNYVNNDNRLHVTGNTNAKANGAMMYARVADFDGDLNMTNGGGFLEVNNTNVGKNMKLTTTVESENPLGYKHFVHVNGYTNVGGDATINSENNIHIGNYNYEEQKLLDGNFKVGGDLTAHANNGHVMTTIDVQADKISYTSDKLNVLSSEDAVLTANEYSFKSNGYIGALKDFGEMSATDQIINVMENYIPIPRDIKSHEYMKIAGGEIKNIEAPKDSQVYIGSYGDVKVTGANAGDINLTAYRKKIEITGPDVHANNINVGPETDYLKLDFEGRDFTTNYTNIRDEKVVTIKPDEEITYELADGGYNQPTLTPEEETTYLIGPDKVVEPEPKPEPEPEPEPTPTPEPEPEPTPTPEPEPEPTPTPEPEPEPTPTPEPEPEPQPAELQKPTDDDNVRVRNWVPEDPMKPLTSTPVAFASDLDDDQEYAGVRKNVDGSVTVVRAYPMNSSFTKITR